MDAKVYVVKGPLVEDGFPDTATTAAPTTKGATGSTTSFKTTTVNTEYPSEPEFNLYIFGREFIIMLSFSLLGPFSYPLLYYICGMGGMRNRLFYGKGIGFQYASWVAVKIPLLLISQCTEETANEVMWMLIVITARAVMIATKYAMMTEKYYKISDIYTVENEILLRRQQLLRSWSKIDTEVLDREVNTSLLRLSLKPEDVILEPALDIDMEIEMCSIDNHEPIDGIQLIKEWITKSDSYTPHIFKPCMFMAITAGFAPLFTRLFKYGDAFGPSLADHISLPCIWVVTSWTTMGNFLFLGVSLIDVFRRQYVMKYCSILLSPIHSKLRRVSYMNKYHLTSMHLLHYNTRTIHSWVNMRRISMEFGMDYVKRLEFYYSITVSMALIACAIFFLEALTNTPGRSVFFQVYNVCPFFTVIYVLVFLFMLIIMGYQLNRENVIQSDILLDYSRRMEYMAYKHLVKNDEIGRHELSISLITLQNAREQLMVDNTLRPFLILGLPAQPIMLKIVLSLIISYVLVLVRMTT